jgi:hypothetical protein
LANGKSPNLRDGQDVLASLTAFPLLISDMLRFIRSVREDEWSRSPEASSLVNAAPSKPKRHDLSEPMETKARLIPPTLSEII